MIGVGGSYCVINCLTQLNIVVTCYKQDATKHDVPIVTGMYAFYILHGKTIILGEDEAKNPENITHYYPNYIWKRIRSNY